MSFRRPKTNARQRAKHWQSWIARHWTELKMIGLPAEVYLDEDHWNDFLENGCLDKHETTGFSFGDLTPDQMTALHRLLEREYGSTAQHPPLLGWVRVRCGMD